jgi:hypothetical protein
MRNADLNKNPQKAPPSQQSQQKPSNQKAPEQKHLSKDTKETFLKKIQFCSQPLDFADESK